MKMSKMPKVISKPVAKPVVRGQGTRNMMDEAVKSGSHGIAIFNPVIKHEPAK